MTRTVYTFFNNKGGVGKTTLLYNLAWMYRELGLRVLMADLDPQANLTAAFLSEERLNEIFTMPSDYPPQTIYEAVKPLVDGTGDIAIPHVQSHPTVEALALVAGDLRLSQFEDSLSETWPKCLSGDARALRITSAFWRVIQGAAQAHAADLIVVDVGPNLGAINRAALIATDYVITPLAPDLFSVMGLRNLGPRLASWHRECRNGSLRMPPTRSHCHLARCIRLAMSCFSTANGWIVRSKPMNTGSSRSRMSIVTQC